MRIEEKKILHTDILIIGGGTAGCYAALTIREKSDYSIIIAEKANIKRSGRNLSDSGRRGKGDTASGAESRGVRQISAKQESNAYNRGAGRGNAESDGYLCRWDFHSLPVQCETAGPCKAKDFAA